MASASPSAPPEPSAPGFPAPSAPETRKAHATPVCPRRGQHFTKQTISHSRDAIPKLVDIARDGDSELKVQPERLIQLGDQAGGKAPDHRADAVD